MKDIIDLLEEPSTTVAVVGATDNSAKYGSVIYRDLKRKGFQVFPVNPSRETVDGDRAFASLSEIPEKPTIANIVVPPEAALKVFEECLALGINNIWIQPGAESPENLDFLQQNNFNYLAHACIMVQSRFRALP